MKILRTWKQKDGIEIVEVHFPGGAHGFEVWHDNKFVVIVPAGSTDDIKVMRSALDGGEDVKNWGCGDTSVGTLMEKTRMREHEEKEEE